MIHRTHLSLIVRRKRMPTLYVVQQLAKALGVTMVELIGDVESNERPGEEPLPLPRADPGRSVGPRSGSELMGRRHFYPSTGNLKQN